LSLFTPSSLRQFRLFPILFVAALAAGCATDALRDPEQPVLERIGEYSYRYEGPELELLLSTKPAQVTVGQTDWVILDLAVSGATRAREEVHREDFALITPGGNAYPMASQEAFREALPQMASMLRRIDVAREPLAYRVGDRRAAGLPFFAEPGEGPAFEMFFVNDRQFYVGPVYFQLPDEVRPGPYRLQVAVGEGFATIPFEIEEPRRRR
jgi:hypothetical protein